MKGGIIMTGMWTIIAAAVSFGISALMGVWLIPFLRKVHFGSTILEDGPKWHKSKQGTPLMGGFMFIAGIIVSTILCVTLFHSTSEETRLVTIKIYAGLLMAVAFGAVGFIDDYIKVVKKRNLGLKAYQKLLFQFLVAAAYLLSIYLSGGTSTTYIPFVGTVDIGLFYWPIAAILIVGMVNAVNLTDGIDGLCGSVTFFGAIFFMMIASFSGYIGMSIFSAAVAGGCLGFLIWNFHPAKVFMGDTGSLFLGGVVCALAFGIDMPILMIPVGIVYIVEMFSDILQVLYFRATHGKRIFKMAPIHHHFEMCGWSEVKIVLVFSVVTIIGGVCAFILSRV